MPKPNRFIRTDNSDAVTQFKNKRFIFRVASQQQCPLFQLPLELRQHIYKFILPRSYRESKSSRRDKLGFEEEWDRPPYTGDPRWEESYQFPVCLWVRGDMLILRLCRRITNEATHLFYSRNMFDMIILGNEPHLMIEYFVPKVLPSAKFASQKWPKCTKKLTSIPHEHVCAIRAWSIIFCNLHTAEAHGKDSHESWLKAVHESETIQATETEELFKEHCRVLSPERQAYRKRVVEGLTKWITIVSKPEVELRHLSVAFESYRIAPWIGGSPMDKKLVRAVREQLPDWILDKVSLLCGKIDEDERDAWNMD